MTIKTIRSQLLLITSAPIIFIVICTSLFFLFDNLDDADRDLETRGKYLTEQFILLSEFHFYTGNIEELTKIGELAMKYEDIDFIRFSDKDYNTLVYLQKETYTDAQVFDTAIYNKSTNLDDFNDTVGTFINDVLGNITFGLSKNEIARKKQKIYIRILSITFFAITGGIFLTLIFSRKLLTGLKSLKTAALQIEAKQFDQRCNEDASGELLKIQKMFNSMAESIQKNEKLLQGRIHFATKSLNSTIAELSEKNEELDKTREQSIRLERAKAIADERTRIMKDMHDGIGGQLVATLALIEKEKKTVIRDNISEILSGCLDDFRLIINSLNTSSNDLSSLFADFKYRMSKRLESLNIQLHWSVVDSIETISLQPQQSLHILRILQETFTNIFKHSNASEIFFKVDNKAEEIHITVEDNGHFITPPLNNTGQGIKNIEWRAGQLGGSVSFSQSSKNGYRIQLIIPKLIFDTQVI